MLPWSLGRTTGPFNQFSLSVLFDSLQPHELQHARLPCPSPTPRACSEWCQLSHSCHLPNSSSVVPFSSCPQSFPESRSFPMSQFFTVSEVAQLRPTLCDPMDCSLPGFSIHENFQARVVEWVAISFSRGSSQPRDRTWVFTVGDQSIGVSASASVLPMNIPDWFPLGLTSLISLQTRDSQESSQHHSSKESMLQHSAFFMVALYKQDLSENKSGTGSPHQQVASATWTAWIGCFLLLAFLFSKLYFRILMFD